MRLIDADLPRGRMESLYEHHLEMCNFSADGAVYDCLEILDEAPTVDVEPVRHGRWIAYEDETMICATEFVCSACRESFVSSELTDKEFYEMMKHCPNCGAKMDEVSE